MRKPSTTSKTPPRGTAASRSTATRNAEIAATLDELERMEPQNPQAAAVAGLLKSWLADDSGYDEKTWPKLKKALNEERRRVGARRLLDE